MGDNCDIMGDNVTLWVTVWHYRWQCDIMGDSLTLWVTVWHYRWQCDLTGDNVTLWVTMWHYGWQCDIMGDNVTLWVTVWHYGWQCDIMGDSVTLQVTIMWHCYFRPQTRTVECGAHWPTTSEGDWPICKFLVQTANMSLSGEISKAKNNLIKITYMH